MSRAHTHLLNTLSHSCLIQSFWIQAASVENAAKAPQTGPKKPTKIHTPTTALVKAGEVAIYLGNREPSCHSRFCPKH